MDVPGMPEIPATIGAPVDVANGRDSSSAPIASGAADRSSSSKESSGRADTDPGNTVLFGGTDASWPDASGGVLIAAVVGTVVVALCVAVGDAVLVLPTLVLPTVNGDVVEMPLGALEVSAGVVVAVKAFTGVLWCCGAVVVKDSNPLTLDNGPSVVMSNGSKVLKGASVVVCNCPQVVKGAFVVARNGSKVVKGASVVVCHGSKVVKGVSVVVYNGSKVVKGASVVVCHGSKVVKGVSVVVYNGSKVVKGASVVVCNRPKAVKGASVVVYNGSKVVESACVVGCKVVTGPFVISSFGSSGQYKAHSPRPRQVSLSSVTQVLEFVKKQLWQSPQDAPRLVPTRGLGLACGNARCASSRLT